MVAVGRRQNGSIPTVAAGHFKTPIRFGILLLDMNDDLFVVLIPCGDGDGDGDSIMSRMTVCKMWGKSWCEVQTDVDYDDAPIICHNGTFYANSREFIYTHEASLAFSNQSEPKHFIDKYVLELFCDGNFADIGNDNQSMYDGSLEDIRELLASYGTVVYCGRIVKDYPEYPDETISFYKLDYDGQKFMRSHVQLKDYAIFNSATQSIICCVKENYVHSTRRFREYYVEEEGGEDEEGEEEEKKKKRQQKKKNKKTIVLDQ